LKLSTAVAVTLVAASSASIAGRHVMASNFIDSSGKVLGTAKLSVNGMTPIVAVSVKGLTPGKHGFHIHPVGKCNLPDFSDAMKHWNPLGHQHGKNNPMGAHMGDLPNLEADAKGTARGVFTLEGINIAGENALIDADGFALIIHANPDDYTADPSGNSGTKIACAPFAGRQK
jgi:superoxide dismutase, Cu-Zn family